LGAGRATSQMLGLPAQIGGYAAGNPAFAAQLGNLFGGSTGLPSSSELFDLQNQAASNISTGAII